MALDLQQVVAGAAVQPVDALAGAQRVVRRRAGQAVIAGATAKIVLSGAAGDPVVAGQAVDRSGHGRGIDGFVVDTSDIDVRHGVEGSGHQRQQVDLQHRLAGGAGGVGQGVVEILDISFGHAAVSDIGEAAVALDLQLTPIAVDRCATEADRDGDRSVEHRADAPVDAKLVDAGLHKIAAGRHVARRQAVRGAIEILDSQQWIRFGCLSATRGREG